MSFLRDIQNLQDIIRRDLIKRYNVKNNQELTTLLSNMSKSDDFLQYDLPLWAGKIYDEFRETLNEVQDSEKGKETLDAASVLKEIHYS